MGSLCAGRVVVITGAGRGLGRCHALAFAQEGARVLVNDVGGALNGEGQSGGPAAEVVEEIGSFGGEAKPNFDDVADWQGAQRMIGQAIDTWGRLDVLVNNAGILRDRMLVNATEDEWDDVMRVHLKGHFCPLRHAATYWRAESKAGRPVDGRVINTSSGAGLQGSIGQGAYATAKAGIASLTIVAGAELGRYGVTVNAIAPAARTRMTEETFSAMMAKPEEGFDVFAPDNVSPLVVWLGSAESKQVTGRVFEVAGGMLQIPDGWRPGPSIDAGKRWQPSEVGEAVCSLLQQAEKPAPIYGA